MKTKQEIVENWLPRYTHRPVKDFTKYILLTNFSKYVEIFATHFHVPILGEDSNMPSASADGVTIINFGMGSANAATVMDLLSAVKPEAVLFLGKCGGIKAKRFVFHNARSFLTVSWPFSWSCSEPAGQRIRRSGCR